MKITVLNYEQFVLDYLEDNLDLTQKVAFEDFMSKHPEIAQEVDGFKIFTLPTAEVSYDSKKLLKKEGAKVKPLFYYATAACWIVLLTSFFVWGMNKEDTNPQAVVEHTQKAIDSDKIVVHLKAQNLVTLSNKNQIKALGQDPQEVIKEISFDQVKFTDDFTLRPFSNDAMKLDIVERENQVIALEPIDYSQFDEIYSTASNSLEIYSIAPVQPNQNESISTNVVALRPILNNIPQETKEKLVNFNLIERIKNELNKEEVAQALTPEFINN